MNTVGHFFLWRTQHYDSFEKGRSPISMFINAPKEQRWTFKIRQWQPVTRRPDDAKLTNVVLDAEAADFCSPAPGRFSSRKRANRRELPSCWDDSGGPDASSAMVSWVGDGGSEQGGGISSSSVQENKLTSLLRKDHEGLSGTCSAWIFKVKLSTKQVGDVCRGLKSRVRSAVT